MYTVTHCMKLICRCMLFKAHLHSVNIFAALSFIFSKLWTWSDASVHPYVQLENSAVNNKVVAKKNAYQEEYFCYSIWR